VAFPATPVLDNFTRANESPIQPPWYKTYPASGNDFTLTSNELTAPAAGTSYVTLSTFTGQNLEAWMDVTDIGNNNPSIFARVMDVGGVVANRWYYTRLAVNGLSVQLFRGATQISNVTVTTGTTNVGAGIRVVGNFVESWYRASGSSVWLRAAVVDDSGFSTIPGPGAIGVRNSPGTGSPVLRVSRFGGGYVNDNAYNIPLLGGAAV
jgi:hypothetical protein